MASGFCVVALSQREEVETRKGSSDSVANSGLSVDEDYWAIYAFRISRCASTRPSSGCIPSSVAIAMALLEFGDFFAIAICVTIDEKPGIVV